jgi:protein SCO1/2
MIRLMMFVVATVAVGALLVMDAVSAAPTLPFYDSADLSPRWARSVDHRVADFKLVTQDGSAITRADLLGQVHIASFIYTHCAGVCPSMITQLKKVQASFKGRKGVMLVSYSVAPHQDTPQTLTAFAEQRGIDSAVWKLVTGDAEQIYALARTSYFADDGRIDPSAPAAEQFLHTEKVILVDRDGRLRGVYNATLPHEIDKLTGDADTLLGDARP